MDSTRTWLLGTASVAVLAGLYIFCSPSKEKRKSKSDKVRGLQNFGNVCFINSVLQALAACPSVIDWLSESVRESEESGPNLTSALLKTLKALNSDDATHDSEILSPLGIIDALKIKRWVIADEQQDAHELFHVLTTTLEEEDSHNAKCFSLLDIKQLERENSSADVYTRCAERNLCVPKHPLPTTGLLASQLQCRSCGKSYPVHYDPFNCISLTIPSAARSPITLQDCLNHFVSSELVTNVACEKCNSSCPEPDAKVQPSKSTFLKQLKFGKLPRCLCIHIQRTVWLNNGMPMKRYEHVIFPEILPMDEYVYSHYKPFSKSSDKLPKRRRLIGGNSEGSGSLGEVSSKSVEASYLLPHLQRSMLGNLQHTSLNRNSLRYSVPSLAADARAKYDVYYQSYNHVYKLMAVIVHLGGVFSGHFVSHRRGPSEGQKHRWYYVSDTSVFETSFSDVTEAPAYMLFYERIPHPNSAIQDIL